MQNLSQIGIFMYISIILFNTSSFFLIKRSYYIDTQHAECFLKKTAHNRFFALNA